MKDGEAQENKKGVLLVDPSDMKMYIAQSRIGEFLKQFVVSTKTYKFDNKDYMFGMIDVTDFNAITILSIILEAERQKCDEILVVRVESDLRKFIAPVAYVDESFETPSCFKYGIVYEWLIGKGLKNKQAVLKEIQDVIEKLERNERYESSNLNIYPLQSSPGEWIITIDNPVYLEWGGYSLDETIELLKGVLQIAQSHNKDTFLAFYDDISIPKIIFVSLAFEKSSFGSTDESGLLQFIRELKRVLD